MKTELAVPVASAVGASLAATPLGIPIAALAGGLAGGVFVMTKNQRMKLWQAVTTLVATTLIGGFVGPLFTAIGYAWLKTKLPDFNVHEAYAQLGVSTLMGIGSQVFWNSLVAAGNSRIRSLGGPKP